MSEQKIVPGASRELKNRIPLRTTVGNSLTMAYRSLLLIRRTPQQLFDVTIQPILFTGMFAFLFGGAISGSVQGYLPIIIPGILAQTALTASITDRCALPRRHGQGRLQPFQVDADRADCDADGAADCRLNTLRHRDGPDFCDRLSPRFSLG